MTRVATKSELNAADRARQVDMKRTFRIRQIAFCVTILAASLIGCGSGGDAKKKVASKPTVARHVPSAPATDPAVSEAQVATNANATSDPPGNMIASSSAEVEHFASSFTSRSGWKVVFRAMNPNLWNNSSDDENGYAIPLDDLDEEIRWLRMRRMDTNESAIIPLFREDLLKVKELDDGVFWNGTGRKVTSRGKTFYQLGIVSKAFSGRYKSKSVLILNPPRVAGSGWSGWGFGKIALIHSSQYFAWAGNRIPETAFEISVTNSDLSSDEKAQLVIPAYGLSASSKAAVVTTGAPESPKSEPPLPTPDSVVIPNPDDKAPDSPERQAVPTEAAQVEAAAAIRKLFQSDFERSTTQQTESLLARKLLEQSRITDDGEATVFVLLDNSRELAANAGDAQIALAAVDEMSDRFEIDSLAKKQAVLSRVASKAKLPIAHRKLAEATLPVIYEAVVVGDFDTAARLTSVARTGARQGRAVDLTAIFQSVSEDIAQFKDDHGTERRR